MHVSWIALGFGIDDGVFSSLFLFLNDSGFLNQTDFSDLYCH